MEQEGVIPIPGARSREQATELLGALGWELGAEVKTTPKASKL